MTKLILKAVLASCMVFTSFALSAHEKVVVIPLGGDEGPTFKTIFVTPETYTGDLKDETKGDADGPSGADRRCMEYAEKPESKVKGKTFKAWLSNGIGTASTNGHFRTFALHNLPYHNTNDEILFNNLEDFDVLPQNSFTTHSGQLVDLNSPVHDNQWPWTGIRSDKTTDPTRTCNT